MISKGSFSWTKVKSTGVLRYPLPSLEHLGHLPTFLFLPGSNHREGATVSTSRGTELGAPKGGFWRSRSKTQEATAFARGGRSAPQLRLGMFSPEPMIRSDSTTGASGSGGALIGPSARRRRGLWGNSAGSCGWRRRRWKTGKGQVRMSRCARRPGRARAPSAAQGTRLGISGFRLPAQEEQGVRTFRRCGAHLLLYRAGGDRGIARDVTATAVGGGGRRPRRGYYPKTIHGWQTPRLPRAYVESRWEEMEIKPQAASLKNTRSIISGGSGVWELVSDSPDFPNSQQTGIN